MSTAIEWTHRPGTKGEVWNPVTGCTKVSAGCTHCYAESVAVRFWGDRVFTDVRCHEDRLAVPLGWRKPRTVFVNSMSDLFHEAVPVEFVDRVFAVMALCPQHTFIVLTKRPERMREYVGDAGRKQAVARRWPALGEPDKDLRWWPLPNAWLGVSVEDHKTANVRVPLLLQTPAALRFVSCEPLLGPVDLTTVDATSDTDPGYSALELRPDDEGNLEETLDWVIVGGESGLQARLCQVEWIRSLRDQAKAAGVPCFIKQLGSNPVVPAARQQHWEWRRIKRPEDKRFTHAGSLWRVHTFDRKGADPSEWPVELRVREWPATEVS